MKKMFFMFLLVASAIFLGAQEAPTEVKTEFDESALNQSIQDLEGNEMTVGDVFKKYEGKVILLDVWASWCPDCIKGLPKLKDVQKQFPEVIYLFFSLDREGKESAWKKAIDKYEIEGEHYWFNSAWKNDFTEYVGLNWIPRYMLIDSDGKIVDYYAIHADDPVMLEAIMDLSHVPEN